MGTVLFILAEAALYVLIVFEKENVLPFSVRYAAILTALAMSLILAVFGLVKKHTKKETETCTNTAERLLLALSMALTAGADWFLVIRGEYEDFLPAVIIFLGAQLAHFAHISFARRSVKGILVSLSARVLLSVASLILLRAMGLFEPLNAFALIYFSNLLMNAADSAVMMPKKRRFILSFLGFLLFVGCDVTVGLNLMGPEWGFSDRALAVNGYLTWIFYLPSQVLIVLSVPEKRKKENA